MPLTTFGLETGRNSPPEGGGFGITLPGEGVPSDSALSGPIAAIVRGDRVCVYAADAWQGVTGDRFLPVGEGPFAGFLSYEVGHVLEPTATAERPGLPGRGMGLDAVWGVGGWLGLRAVPSEDASVARAGLVTGPYTLGPMRSAWGRLGYVRAVERAVGLIHAGDLYQVNLAHALVGRFEGCPRALFADMSRASSPAFGCYLELPPLADGRRRAVLCVSPELLVRYDASTRVLTTEPMKGTRPATADGLAQLRVSAKDCAELAMIVDLMRNDVGRVGVIGSVRVDEPRMIERHGPAQGGVWQASARVLGRLRDGLGLEDVLGALLPAGSITGAPKVRAMQVVHALEPTPRGPYCGAIGVLDGRGGAELAVGIRTALVVGDELRYSVGAGIVAQSEPEAEWAETLAKAGPLRAIGAVIEDDGSWR